VYVYDVCGRCRVLPEGTLQVDSGGDLGGLWEAADRLGQEALLTQERHMHEVGGRVGVL
jgi:hypothetical protein